MNISSISQIQPKKEIDSETKLFIFNPEHDFALAVGTGPYTPPAEILKIRKKLSLLPALYADNGDSILIRDDLTHEEIRNLPYFDVAENKNINLIHATQLPLLERKIKDIIPWGWDFALTSYLLSIGIPSDLLPQPDKLVKLRELSHRRLTLPFRESVSKFLDKELLNPAKELFSLEDVGNFLNKHPKAFLKAPWSSSGRGVISSDHITNKGLLEWSHGIIRRQGSIIAEPAWNRVLDFATEWVIKEGTPIFLGYSVFKTSSRGKYHGNIEASQEELLKMIKKYAPDFSVEIINSQQQTIKNLIAPYYDGPLGIDMLVDSDGNVNTCVEINLRLTMGHILLGSQLPIFTKKD